MNKQIDEFNTRRKNFYRNIVGAYRYSDLYDSKKGQRQNMLADLTKQGFSDFDDHLNDLYWRKKIDMTFEYTKITIPNKRFLWSDEFKNWDNDKKSIALCNMIGQWSEIFTKAEFMNLVKDWSPNLKSIALVSFFQDNESIDGDFSRRAQNFSFTINDLDTLEINQWPEKTRYDFISWPLRNKDCSAFSDLQAVEDLENSTTFKEASQDIKLLLIEKLLANHYKNLVPNTRHVNFITLAKKNLTPGYLNRLAWHIYKKYGLVNNFDNEIIKAFDKIYQTRKTMKLIDLQKLNGYDKLDGNSKLHFLTQCDKNDLTVENFDKLLPELDLNDYMTRKYTLKTFFSKSGITADIIAQKNNWPIDVKTVAFKALPKSQRTEKNFKIIFLLALFDDPKLLSSENLGRVKSGVKEYINILRPDFNLSYENEKRMNALIKQVDDAKNKEDLRKLFDQMTIYKTMSELNADQIAEYINKIQGLIGNDEKKAKAYCNYLYNNGKLPDFIEKDSDLAGFVHYVKNAFDKRKDDFEFWGILAISSDLGLEALVISAVILAPESLLVLSVIPFIAVVLSPAIIVSTFLGIGFFVSESRLKKNLAATKTEEFTKQLENLKKEVDKAIGKDPKLKQKVKNITDKIKQQEDKINALSDQEIALYNFIDKNYKDADERKKNIKEILDLSQGSREDLAFELTTEVMLDISLRDDQKSTEKEVYNFIDENYKEDADERKKNIKEILDNTNDENRETVAADILKQLVDGKSKQEQKENTVSQDAKIINQAEIENKNLDNDILNDENKANENIEETNKNNDIENKNDEHALENNEQNKQEGEKLYTNNVQNENKNIDVADLNEQNKQEGEKLFTNNVQNENKNIDVADLNEQNKQEEEKLYTNNVQNENKNIDVADLNEQNKQEEEKLFTNNIQNENKNIDVADLNEQNKQEGEKLFTNNESSKETKVNSNSSDEKTIKDNDQKNNERKIKLSDIKKVAENESQDIDDDRKAILTKLKELKEKKNFGKKLGNDRIE